MMNEGTQAAAEPYSQHNSTNGAVIYNLRMSELLPELPFHIGIIDLLQNQTFFFLWHSFYIYLSVKTKMQIPNHFLFHKLLAAKELTNM